MAEQPMVLRANECLLEAEAILRNLVIAENTRAQGGRNRPQTRRYVMRDAKADARRALDQIGAARLALLGTEAFLDMPLGVQTAPAIKPEVAQAMAAEYTELMAHMDSGGDYFEFMAKRQHPSSSSNAGVPIAAKPCDGGQQ